ncbi:hypothetical protein E2C01_055418 [Portunus trituberculatus]|uniref:Uncharacterized protein n=1 Tax=Portunus trituberculatus TaxID=210409 RepID=A0A5B7GWR7_PORTR|nr:hypothetical protein [Portunus trituberculatus]
MVRTLTDHVHDAHGLLHGCVLHVEVYVHGHGLGVYGRQGLVSPRLVVVVLLAHGASSLLGPAPCHYCRTLAKNPTRLTTNLNTGQLSLPLRDGPSVAPRLRPQFVPGRERTRLLPRLLVPSPPPRLPLATPPPDHHTRTSSQQHGTPEAGSHKS